MLRRIVWAACLVAALAPRAATAGAVVVFPLDARGVARDTAEAATQKLESALRALRGLEVIETAAVERRLGLHLTEQARACEYDVFCLVEVGEVLRSERILIGHVRKTPRSGDEVELKLFVLDVAKASVVEVLVWKVTGGAPGLGEAAQAAARRLFAKPDAKLVLEPTPSSAEVYFYGDLVPRTLGGPLDWWSGAYEARFQAEGFQPQSARVVVSPGGTTRVPVTLQPDLLYVPKAKEKKVNPFAKSSRREGGSGVSAEEAGALEDARPGAVGPSGPSAFANPLAWSAVGAGVAAVVVGAVLANGAQREYNALSGQERYLPGVTLSSAQASQTRDDARAGFRAGSAIALSGAAVALGGLVWMIIDSASPSAPVGAGGRGAASVGEWRF